jgi:hypothetical protein
MCFIYLDSRLPDLRQLFHSTNTTYTTYTTLAQGTLEHHRASLAERMAAIFVHPWQATCTPDPVGHHPTNRNVLSPDLCLPLFWPFRRPLVPFSGRSYLPVFHGGSLLT